MAFFAKELIRRSGAGDFCRFGLIVTDGVPKVLECDDEISTEYKL